MTNPLSMIQAILTAIEIIGKVPQAAEAIRKTGLSMSRLFAAKEKEIPIPAMLQPVIDGEQRKLKDLIDRYYAIDNDPRYTEVEKNEYRKRIAAQVCALLNGAAPISDQIPDYDKLKKLFCESLPATL